MIVPRSKRTSLRLAMMVVIAGSMALLLAPASASAQVVFGVRGGLSIDPDQAYFGAHVETEPLVERLHFRPNIELGVGDHLTLLAFNGEFVWKFPEGRSGWTPYAGGGPAINVYWFSSDHFGNRDAEMQAGINVLGGFEHSRGLFFEFKVGGLDSPDLKVGVGYTWR